MLLAASAASGMQVRKSINVMAEGWSPEQKEHCLAETEASFKYSGVILRCITEVA